MKGGLKQNKQTKIKKLNPDQVNQATQVNPGGPASLLIFSLLWFPRSTFSPNILSSRVTWNSNLKWSVKDEQQKDTPYSYGMHYN